MEPAGSILCSQEFSTGLYPKPDQSNPSHPILSLYDLILVISNVTCMTEFYDYGEDSRILNLKTWYM
jgi:hypothetical protein